MTEKVIFEFRAWNEKDKVKYEIRQGEEIYNYSRRTIPRCSPVAFFPHLKSYLRLHRRFIQRSRKRVRNTLNALESMYADFYRNENSTQERNDRA